MSIAESEIKSPFVPFFKGGIFSGAVKPLFGKEGQGRFFPEPVRNYLETFWITTLVGRRYLARALPAVAPPSRTSVAPVMYRPAFDARKTTISATSLGLP